MEGELTVPGLSVAASHASDTWLSDFETTPIVG